MTDARRYGRTELSAHKTSTEILVLGGQQFTKEDFQTMPTAQPMLQLPPSDGCACADELAQLQAEVQKTLAQQTRSIKLRRTPQRNKAKQWMLGGRRLAASEVSIDEQGAFVPRSYANIEEALQQIVFELDGVRSGGSDISSSSSTLEN